MFYRLSLVYTLDETKMKGISYHLEKFMEDEYSK